MKYDVKNEIAGWSDTGAAADEEIGIHQEAVLFQFSMWLQLIRSPGIVFTDIEMMFR